MDSKEAKYLSKYKNIKRVNIFYQHKITITEW